MAAKGWDSCAARARLHLEIEAYLLALQMLGQTGSVRLVARDRWLLGYRHKRQQLLCPTDIGTEILQPQFQLVTVEAFGPPAEVEALELLNDQPQALDLGLGFGEGSPFARPIRRKIADWPMKRINIIRQGSKIDVHGSEDYAHSRCIASKSVFPESIGRSRICLRPQVSRSAPAKIVPRNVV